MGIGKAVTKTPDGSPPLLTSSHRKYYDNWYCTGSQCSRQEKEIYCTSNILHNIDTTHITI